jgi:serine/threonine-protein kinase
MASAGSSASSDAFIPKHGDLVGGRYVADAILGRGASSIVMTAHHPDLARTVAIKILRDWGALPQARDRIVREARALTLMQSEHVVRVMDVALHEGAPFIVMEHLEGQDLARVLRERGPLPIADVIDYVLQACDAIAEAHARGIIHRDLKPSNVFLTKRIDGSPLVKVIDFGIAKTPASVGDGLELSLTDTAAILGSPMYMSPEQVRSSKHVDHRTDVWSLGVIVYRLLTGVAPFEGETFSSVCAAIIADEPVSLRVRRPEVPEALWHVVERCMKKDAVWRYASVLELARALEPFASELGRASIQRLLRAAPVAVPAAEPAQAATQEAPLEGTLGAGTFAVPADVPAPSRTNRRIAWGILGAAAAAIGVVVFLREGGERSTSSTVDAGVAVAVSNAAQASSVAVAASGAPSSAVVPAAPITSASASPPVAIPTSAPRSSRPPVVHNPPSTGSIDRALDERR